MNVFTLLAQYVPTEGVNNAVGNGSDIQNVGGMTNTGIFGPGSVVTNVINIMMYIVGIIAVIMIIAGGIMYATAAGDEAKTKKARTAIVGGLIGLAFAILAWTLVNFVFVSIGGH
jgi:hypothetical protein